MPTFQPPYGTVDAPDLGAAQKWLAKQKPAAPQQDTGSAIGAFWHGLTHEAGQTLRGTEQLVNRLSFPALGGAARAGQQRVSQAFDTDIARSEQSFQANPETAKHLWASMLGRGAGAIAATAPLMMLPGGAGLAGRVGMGALTGGLAGATQPVTGGNFAAEKAKQIGAGAAGGGILSGVVGSTLGKAIAGNSPQQIESALSKTFRRVVKPGRAGRASASQLEAQDRQILSAVDSIIADKPNLNFTDESGRVVTGQLPRSIRQFSDAIDQQKKRIFQQYDQMAQKAGRAGIMIDLTPTVTALRMAAAKPEVEHLHPSVAADLNALADRFETQGAYPAEVAQDIVQNLNATLRGFYKNPTQEIISGGSALGNITPTLRKSLDESIAKYAGPGYQALRNQYGSLRSVEKDVAAAFQREVNKIPGGLGQLFSDIAASEEALRGVITLNPQALLRAGGIKAAQMLMRHINSPNRAITRMFEMRARPPMSPGRQITGAILPAASGVVGGQTGAETVRKRPALEFRIESTNP